MQYRPTRYLVALFLIFVIPATPVLARDQASGFHHGLYRHQAGVEAAHREAPRHRHRIAMRYRHHHVYAAAEPQTAGVSLSVPFGGQLASGFAAPTQPSFGAAQYGRDSDQSAGYAGMVAEQASANGVPTALVHRVIMRESRYNPRAVSRGNYGIMQIRLGTARAMGYGGSAEGLLDAATNMTYAVRYLAGAYRAAGGNADRAVALYARGYYQEAKNQESRAREMPPYAAPGDSGTAAAWSNASVAWLAPLPATSRSRLR